MIDGKGAKRFLVFGLLTVLLAAETLVPISGTPAVQAANGLADAVLGQPIFTTNIANNPTPLGGLSRPAGLATDPASGRLFVSDSFNNRVLSWPDAASFTNGQQADLVIGQQDFASIGANTGGISERTLSGPMGLAVDEQGNLLVADFGNNRVLVYQAPLSTGMAAAVVLGQPDFQSGTANNGGVKASSLYRPYGLALDANRRLYVADEYNHRVLFYAYPVTNHAAALTVFGQPNMTSNSLNNGGVVSASSLAFPMGIAVDDSGNLYVADNYNNRVLEYDSPWLNQIADRVFGQAGFTTSAANQGGTPSGATLSGPRGVAWDVGNRLFVADTNNNRVLIYPSPLTNQTAYSVIGQANMQASVADVSDHWLDHPYAVGLDRSRNWLIADYGNNRVLRWNTPISNPDAQISSLAPSETPAIGHPFTLAINGSAFVYPPTVKWKGEVRTATFVSSRRLLLSLSGTDDANAGNFAVEVSNPGQLSTPDSSSITLYLPVPLDKQADRVFGQPDFSSWLPGNPALPAGARLSDTVAGVTASRWGEFTFVADCVNSRVLGWYNVTANSQAADLVFGQPDMYSNSSGPSATTLSCPTSVAIDSSNRVYVADTNNSRIVRYSPPYTNGMAADLVIGQPSLDSGTANYNGVTGGSLRYPQGLALDLKGNLYVADSGNNRVLAYSAPLTSGQYASKVFGQQGFTTNDANLGGITAATLKDPWGVAVDASYGGTLFVADRGNSRVLVYYNPFLSGGAVADRVYGQPDMNTGTPNTGGLSESTLWLPRGVAVDSASNLYVADFGNNRVLEYGFPYNAPTTNGDPAIAVFGQPDFKSNAANNGGLSAKSLLGPDGLFLDSQNNIFVIDAYNARLLKYETPLANTKPYIYNPQPALASAGGKSFTLTLDGANLVYRAIVRWNGVPLTTNYWNSTRLTAVVPADNIATTGTATITVVNPEPGGGTSNSVTFKVDLNRIYLPVTLQGYAGGW